MKEKYLKKNALYIIFMILFVQIKKKLYLCRPNIIKNFELGIKN